MERPELGFYWEIARQLQSNPPDVGIDIIFFDGEDNGKDNDYQGTDYAEHNGWCSGFPVLVKKQTSKKLFRVLWDSVGYGRRQKFEVSKRN